MRTMEEMGKVINPLLPAFQDYLQTGFVLHQQQQYLLSSSSTAVVSQPPTPSRAGTAVVVHEGGRVVLHKGEYSLIQRQRGRGFESWDTAYL